MHTQGCHGCQMSRNFVRNSKILIARSTIQPKLGKIKNNLPFFKEVWWSSSWLLISLNFGWMVDLAISIFEFLTKFLVCWHPWHPWVCVRSDWNRFEPFLLQCNHNHPHIFDAYCFCYRWRGSFFQKIFLSAGIISSFNNFLSMLKL